MYVKIVKRDGGIYETPIENLENIKRLIPYDNIIFPDNEEQENTEYESELKPKRGRKPSNQLNS